MKTPTKFLPVRMPKCGACGDAGWKFLSLDDNTVVPCACDEGAMVSEAYEHAESWSDL